MKKIIIILTAIALVLIVLVVFLLNRNTPDQMSTTEDVLPTGIIIPTKEIAGTTLDIVKILPEDQTQNIRLEQALSITFSRKFTSPEVEFVIDPDTPFTSEIIENNLVIKPLSTWQPGTLYTFSLNFPNDPEKVRLYRFMTAGPTQAFLPDTQPKGAYEAEMAKQKANDPDIYVANQTPYDAPNFFIKSVFKPEPPAHFGFIVTIKDAGEAQARTDVNLWLQSLDLTSAQISSLDITYE